MNDLFRNASAGDIGFWAWAGGAIAQLFSVVNGLSLVHVIGFVVSVAGLIVQVAVYLNNRREAEKHKAEKELAEAEKAKTEAETIAILAEHKREEDRHEIQVKRARKSKNVDES